MPGLGVSRPPLATFRLDWAGLYWGCIATLPPLGLLWFCMKIHWRPFERIMQVLDETFIPLFRQCRIIELLVISRCWPDWARKCSSRNRSRLDRRQGGRAVWHRNRLNRGGGNLRTVAQHYARLCVNGRRHRALFRRDLAGYGQPAGADYQSRPVRLSALIYLTHLRKTKTASEQIEDHPEI